MVGLWIKLASRRVRVGAIDQRVPFECLQERVWMDLLGDNKVDKQLALICQLAVMGDVCVEAFHLLHTVKGAYGRVRTHSH